MSSIHYYPQNRSTIRKNYLFSLLRSTISKCNKNFRIRKFWAQKPPDPEVLQNWVIKIDDYISQETSYTKTKFTTVSNIHYFPQNRSTIRKNYLFSLLRSTISKCNKNFRIRKFWGWKLPDPEVLSLKTSGSGSFEIQNFRIQQNFFLKNASKIFLKGRIDEKKKLRYAQLNSW